MTQYLLSIYQPDGEAPSGEELQKVMQDMHALIEDAQGCRALVFQWANCRGRPPSCVSSAGICSSPTLRRGQGVPRGLHRHQGAGFDAALVWAGKLARVLALPGHAQGLSVKVRPFFHAAATSAAMAEHEAAG